MSSSSLTSTLPLSTKELDEFEKVKVVFRTISNFEERNNSEKKLVELSYTHPNELEVWIELMNHYFYEGKNVKSLECANHILSIDPNNIIATLRWIFVSSYDFERQIVDRHKKLQEKVHFLLNTASDNGLVCGWLAFWFAQKGDERERSTQYYEKAKNLDPENFEVLFCLAMQNNEHGKHDLEKVYYEKSHEKFPFFAAVKIGMLKLKSHEADVETIEKGGEEILREYPNELLLLMHMCGYFHFKKDADRMFKWIQLSLEIYPKSYNIRQHEVHYYYYLKNDPTKAESLLNNMLEIEPERAEVLCLLGDIMRTRDRNFEKAIDYYEKSIRYEPKSNSARVGLLLAYIGLGSWEDAREVGAEAYKIEPNGEFVMDLYVRVLFQLDDYEAALPIALKLFDIHPDFETSQRLANIYWAKADWENAKIYAMKAQEINPRAWQPHHVLGFCFRGFGKPLQAQHSFKRCLELNPNPIEKTGCYHELGVITEREGKIQDAIAWYEKALEVTPDYYFSIIRIAILNLNMGNKEKAEKLLLQALSIAPKYIPIREYLGRIYRDSHRIVEATEQYEEILKIEKDNQIAISGIEYCEFVLKFNLAVNVGAILLVGGIVTWVGLKYFRNK